VDSQLPPALSELLARIRDEAVRDRFRAIFDLAARAIRSLHGFEMIRYESQSAEGSEGLELLGEVAPVLTETLTDVNGLAQLVEESFPTDWRAPAAEPGESERIARAIQRLRERTLNLRAEVLLLGSRLRSPEAVADRWNLLGNLQSARGRLRSGIGEMVADFASVFGEAARVSVVPEYELDLERALLLRQTVAKLTVGLRVHNARLKTVSAAELPGLAGKVEGLLDLLGKTPTWYELRAADKREFLRFHEELTRARTHGHPPSEVLPAVAAFVSYLEQLGTVVNQRTLLQDHDRARLAELTVLLEKAEGQSGAEAEVTVRLALEACDSLVGRDLALDRYLDQLKNAPQLVPADCIKGLRYHALRLLGG
jgi:hypothetical protein